MDTKSGAKFPLMKANYESVRVQDMFFGESSILSAPYLLFYSWSCEPCSGLSEVSWWFYSWFPLYQLVRTHYTIIFTVYISKSFVSSFWMALPWETVAISDFTSIWSSLYTSQKNKWSISKCSWNGLIIKFHRASIKCLMYWEIWWSLVSTCMYSYH